MWKYVREYIIPVVLGGAIGYYSAHMLQATEKNARLCFAVVDVASVRSSNDKLFHATYPVMIRNDSASNAGKFLCAFFVARGTIKKVYQIQLSGNNPQEIPFTDSGGVASVALPYLNRDSYTRFHVCADGTEALPSRPTVRIEGLGVTAGMTPVPYGAEPQRDLLLSHWYLAVIIVALLCGGRVCVGRFIG